MVCNNTKLLGVLFKTEPDVPLVLVLAKVLTSNDAVKKDRFCHQGVFTDEEQVSPS